MNSNQDKPKWWRPRWSVRTLVVFVTLGCAYLACWGPTKTQGVAQVERKRQRERGLSASLPKPIAIAPLIVRSDGSRGAVFGNINADDPFDIYDTHYYFWFFGHVGKLPWEHGDMWPEFSTGTLLWLTLIVASFLAGWASCWKHLKRRAALGNPIWTPHCTECPTDTPESVQHDQSPVSGA